MRQGRQRAARSQWQARRWQWQAKREPGRQGRQRAAREAKETRNGGKGTAKGGKGSQWQRAAREAAKGTASAVSSEPVWKGPQGKRQRKRQRKRQAQPRLSLAQSGNRALSRSLAPRRALPSPQPKPKPTSSRALDELFSASRALLGCMESQCELQDEQVAHLLPRTAAPTQRREHFFGRLCVLGGIGDWNLSPHSGSE